MGAGEGWEEGRWRCSGEAWAAQWSALHSYKGQLRNPLKALMVESTRLALFPGRGGPGPGQSDPREGTR